MTSLYEQEPTETAKRAAKRAVLNRLKEKGEVSPRELEQELAPQYNGKMIRETIFRLISGGEIRVNDNLKLEIRSS